MQRVRRIPTACLVSLAVLLLAAVLGRLWTASAIARPADENLDGDEPVSAARSTDPEQPAVAKRQFHPVPTAAAADRAAPSSESSTDAIHDTRTLAARQTLWVSLRNGLELHGELLPGSGLTFETTLGEVTPPPFAMTGVRMGSTAYAPATICLHNGDSLTGQLTNEAITIRTAWGLATVRREHLLAVATRPQVRWQRDANRWRPAPDAAPAAFAGEAAPPEDRPAGRRLAAPEFPVPADAADAAPRLDPGETLDQPRAFSPPAAADEAEGSEPAPLRPLQNPTGEED